MSSKAQFIVIAAFLISIIVTSLAVSLYLTATQYQEFRYKPWKEIIINIDKDFKRALTRILALSTRECNKTFTEANPFPPSEFPSFGTKAKENISYWCQVLVQSYPDAGLQLNLIFNGEELEELSESCNGVEGNDRLIYCCWGSSKSFSVIYAKLAINLIDYGLYGYVSEGYIALNALINNIEIKKMGNKAKVNFTLHVEKEYGEPVASLSIENYNFTNQDTLTGWLIGYLNSNNQLQFLEASNITDFKYSAGGNYNIVLNIEDKNINPKSLSLWLWIRDERGILVIASTISHLVTEYFYLTVETDPSEIVDIPGEGYYESGASVTLEAPQSVKVDNEHYLFDHWEVKVTGSNGIPVTYKQRKITVYMDDNYTATACYKLKKHS